jgi:hypothetical protein
MPQVPAQRKGAQSDIKYSKKISTREEAEKIFEKARKNLLNINEWHLIAGKLSARFYLTDPYGKNVQRLPLHGDFIKIHLPSSAEDKFDWVRIESIEDKKISENLQVISMLVRPSDPPRQKEETEHFFSKDATSSFIVERKGNVVTAYVRGRNELPNTDEPESILKKIRNAAIALAAMAGLNTPQWKGLAKGIINE